MNEDAVFFQQAAEALIATSLKNSNVDPTIKELLNRLKHVKPGVSATRVPQQIPLENKSVLDYFDQLLSNTDVISTSTDAVSSSSFGSGADRKRRRSDTAEHGSQDERKDDGSGSKGSTSLDDDPTAKKFPCAKCDLIFRRSSDLRRHERAHLPILPNICTLCGKGFARKDALKRHFDTMTCKRNREKLLSIGGDINEILEKAKLNGAKV
ncbi:LADA_0D05864g1_1 [Lachancea dasiensis]|uniref:LADA_0D05864g1_1 n=1 Tax=Lachancea dasiensis TaxID=1072105 RepID=A0A1G4J5Z2_9SACH|nr:LADA_0D05864g1_1 [Lachancea dasiensis]